MKCPTCSYELNPSGASSCSRCLSSLTQPSGQDIHVAVDINVGTVEDGGSVDGVNVAQARDVYVDVDPRKAAQLRRDRHNFLNLVWNAWIKDVLERIEATHTAVTSDTTLIPLNKQAVPTAVLSPSDARNAVAHLVDDSPPAIADVDVSAIFDRNGRSLLILGQPGAGKTVALLQIARDTLRSAWQNPQAPIPVVLNLASWAQDTLPLEEWLVKELNSPQYRIPHGLAEEWLARNELLLLLDGLDEVPRTLRDDCVRAINRFTRDHFIGIAITSRSQEYYNIYQEPFPGAEHNQLELRQAIELLPLTNDQVDTYLRTSDNRLGRVQQALLADSDLREMANTPLMLGIFSATYGDDSTAPLPQAGQTAVESRAQLLNAYVTRMFAYGGDGDKKFDDNKTMRWLGWLANQMEQHHISTFFIEQMQPSWLSERKWQITYMYSSRLIITLIGGIIGGLVLGIANSLMGGRDVVLLGFIQGLMGGMIAGLVVGTVDTLWVATDIEPIARQSKRRQATVKFGMLFVAVWLAVIVGFTLLAIPVDNTALDFAFSIDQGVMVGLILALALGWVFAFGPGGVRQTLSNDIQSVEHLSWSPDRALRYGIYGLLIGAIVGVISVFVARWTPLIWPLEARFGDMTIVALIMLLLGAIFIGLAGMMLGGIRGSIVEGDRQRPNEGFHMSMVNAAVTGSAIGLLFGAMGAFVGWLIDGRSQTILTMALYGLFFGVIAAIWFGGLFAVQHATLRTLLVATGKSPRLGKFTLFLNHAARHVFLRKVGGGYIFIHRYLQDYFADTMQDDDQ